MKLSMFTIQFFLIVALSTATNDESFDYYRLSTMWSKLFCNTAIRVWNESTMDKRGEQFTLHGLWPTKGEEYVPPSKKGIEFTRSMVRKLIT